MNNLIESNMKRTIFEGTVNGEKFDNVQDYNARVRELLESGEFESASSNTRVEEYNRTGYCRTCDDTPSVEGTLTTTADNLPWENDCECDCCDPFEDDELSFYPYLDQDDPFYLDLLVTNHRETNKEALAEVVRVFEKCARYILDALEDPDTDLETKENYLEDIKDIIGSLVEDKNDTIKGIKSIDDKINEIVEKERAFRKECNDQIEELRAERLILTESNPVIDKFLEFYRGVQSDVLLNIKHTTEKGKCTCGGNCTCDKNKNDVDKYKGVEISGNKVATECKQVNPQVETDLNKILEKIFGPLGLK